MIAPVSLRHRIFWNATIVVSIIIAIYSTVFCLTRGIYEVFPFLYFLPIILFVNFYPKRGVVFSLAISTIFLLLVSCAENRIFVAFCPWRRVLSTIVENTLSSNKSA